MLPGLPTLPWDLLRVATTFVPALLLKSSGRTPWCVGRQIWHGTLDRTVHQERYNPLKAGDQPQEAWAKVRQDFGVRSVTLRASARAEVYAHAAERRLFGSS